MWSSLASASGGAPCRDVRIMRDHDGKPRHDGSAPRKSERAMTKERTMSGATSNAGEGRNRLFRTDQDAIDDALKRATLFGSDA